MTNKAATLSRARLAIAGGVILMLLIAWLLPMGSNERTVTAHFPQAVSIFKGSDVTIMGVSVGRVTEVVPEANSVKVVMTYSDKYKLPADVNAAIVTPTLVADRFVQFVPAYSGGAAMPDNGDIPLERSYVPVEMDRIYRSINTITETLGPQGANHDGALGKLLASSAKALDGNGQLGHDALENMAQAARTLGDNSPELFDTVENLAGITQTLAANDDTVRAFLRDLSKVSVQLAGEGDELDDLLASIARAVDVTKDFVKDNKSLLAEDLNRLGRIVGVILKEKESLKTTLELAPLGMTNLALSFDAVSSGAGIRVQLTPTASDFGNVLCGIVTQAGIPNPQPACDLLKAIIPALAPIPMDVPVSTPAAAGDAKASAAATPTPTSTPLIPPVTVGTTPIGQGAIVDQIQQLLGGGQ